MTTATPRTDAIHGKVRPDPWIEVAYSEMLDHARTLELDLRECVELLERLEEPQELNPSNYGHEQVCELNAKMVELCLASRALLARFKESKTP